MSQENEKQTDALHPQRYQGGISSNPYRVSTDEHRSKRSGTCEDYEAIFIYVLMLIICSPAVVTAILHRETFGAETSLEALIVVLCLGMLGSTLIRALSLWKQKGARESDPSPARRVEEQDR
jgi:hypothetical protein